MYELVETDEFRDDREHWRTGNRNVLKKLGRLLIEVREHPRRGTGHPERLKHQEGEVWSRKLTKKDRLVYRIEGTRVVLLQARFHYDDR